MSVRTEIKGNRYGKWTALGEFEYRLKPNGRRKCYELCKCDCGTVKYVRRDLLLDGKSTNCGCFYLSKEYRAKLSNANSKPKTHGMNGTAFYKKYRDIYSRCYNVNRKAYKNYGGIGIKCLWKTFEEFMNDMYESYLEHCKIYGERETTIDRIDNNGNYCKENCKWSTFAEQNRNRRCCKNFISIYK